MFFSLTKRKIISISIIVMCLVFGASLTIYLNGKFSLTKAISLYIRKTRATSGYWLSHKISVFGSTGETINLASFGVGNARSIPVLAYHGLPNEGIGQIPQDRFVEQMRTLKDAGWKTITLEELDLFLDGEINLPARSFLLTFDDGRKDTFYPADPVLKDLGFNAVMFAISKKSAEALDYESNYYMSEYELLQMERSGRWEVESHGRDSHDWYNLDKEGTIGHFFSNRLWLQDKERVETEEEYRTRVVYDLVNSKRDLENSLGKEVRFLAFPFGDYGQDSVNYKDSRLVLDEEVRKFYDRAFFQVWKGVAETYNYPHEAGYMVKRIEPDSDWSGEFLLQTLNAGEAKELPYSVSEFGMEWSNSWGKVEKGESLNLEAEENISGASSSLGGSWYWQDYEFRVDTNWQQGSNIVLVARKFDEDNYYGCNFGKEKTYIKKTKNDSSYNIADQEYNISNFADVNLGVRVRGYDVSCLVDGQVVISNTVNFDIPNGGVGIEIWDAAFGVASVTFDNISVTPI